MKRTGFTTSFAVGMILMAFLSYFCLTPVQLDAQSRGTVIYDTNTYVVYPTNIFVSNIIAGANITITLGANGRITIASSGGGAGAPALLLESGGKLLLE